MRVSTFVSRLVFSTITGAALLVLASFIFAAAPTTLAAVLEQDHGAQVLIGRDEDTQDNPAVQQASAANQSLNRTDVLEGGSGNDVLFGLNGNDVIDGGSGKDIILGGPDGGPAPGGVPNSDIMFGGPGNDVNLWAPGDGSEAFLGGEGTDAIVFGSTDRELTPGEAGVRLPTLFQGVPGFPGGIPTADISGLANFVCTIENSPISGYEFLIRFRSAATNSILATVRVRDVEQVFCPVPGGGAVAFADLTARVPTFAIVPQSAVDGLNRLVGAMAR